MKRPIQIVVCLILFFARPAFSQLIKEEFGIPVFSDPFDEDKNNWRNMSTSDNLFLIQDGEYLLRRKNTVSGYSIFPRWKNTLPAFSLTAGIKLEDSKNPDASVGLIFMAQEDESGAFVFEYNPKGQYRLKQLVGLSFKLLTGETKKDGWVDSDVLNPPGQYNLIEIRSSKRNYDIYVNEKYLLSFTEVAYKTGNIGISVGPATRARIDFILVKEPGQDPGTSGLSTGSVDEREAELSDPATQVKVLNEQVSSLKAENEMLRDSIRLLRKKLKSSNATPKQNP